MKTTRLPGVRTQIILPAALKSQIEERAQASGQSLAGYLRQAAEAQLLAEKNDQQDLHHLASEVIGALKISDYPEWETPAKLNAWLDELRQEWD